MNSLEIEASPSTAGASADLMRNRTRLSELQKRKVMHASSAAFYGIED